MAVDHALQQLDELLISVADSAVPLLRETSHHILGAGGKRVRPRLLLLAFEATGGANFDVAIPLAAAVEIIHTATLVHDDINDHGTLRRGRETVNSRWGGTFALLTGDYLFSRTYELMAPYSTELNLILARASTALVEGETMQIQAAREGTFDTQTYFEIISRKTAALFVAAAELGATSAEAPAEQVRALSQYAFNLGIAFQLIDDVLDLAADSSQLGKNAGIDIAQGRGIAVAIQGGAGSNHSAPAVEAENDISPEALQQSILRGATVEQAIAKGREKGQEFAQMAIDHLAVLSPSTAVDELRELAHQVVERDR
ncbi:MAG: polyprenyl synthetase family protein [Chloroflexi bacterium]|nr:polyprenyl synthetase family protein [Chloroflexota bacterium]